MNTDILDELMRAPRSQVMIEQFLRRLGHAVPKTPTRELMTETLRVAWARIFFEEVLEFLDGMGVSVIVTQPRRLYPHDVKSGPSSALHFTVDDSHDLVPVADGAADVEYVAQAICTLYGINLEPHVREVCRNNLLKFGPGHTFSDGKLVKPPNHPKPRISEIIVAQLRGPSRLSTE